MSSCPADAVGGTRRPFPAEQLPRPLNPQVRAPFPRARLCRALAGGTELLRELAQVQCPPGYRTCCCQAPALRDETRWSSSGSTPRAGGHRVITSRGQRGPQGLQRAKGAGLGSVPHTPTARRGKLFCRHRQRSWEDRARIWKGQISPHHSSKSFPTAQQKDSQA